MNILPRMKNILLQPKAEWAAIAAESTGTAELYLKYIIPLAAIGPVATFIGMSLLGYDVPLLGRFRTPILAGLSTAVVSYVLALVGVFAFALVIDALAPTFGGTKDPLRALRVATYSFTPAWLAGILFALPALGVLAILAGLYGIYLLYLGLPVLMKSDVNKALPYTLVSILGAIVIHLTIAMASAAVAGFGAGQPPLPSVAADPEPAAADGLTAEQRQALENLKAISEAFAKTQGDE